MQKQKRMADIQRTDMRYWYPLAQNLVDTPQTIEVKIPDGCILYDLLDGSTPCYFEKLIAELCEGAQLVGYPFFLRTGFLSNKHDWKKSCFVSQAEDIPSHLLNLVEISAMADQGLDSFFVREMLPASTLFKAFFEFPVTREFRFKLEDSKVTHVQPYWPPDAIREHTKAEGWKDLLAQASKLSKEEFDFLAKETSRLGEVLAGDWSVDWLQTKDGRWKMIDMAAAALSFWWEPECDVVISCETSLRDTDRGESNQRSLNHGS